MFVVNVGAHFPHIPYTAWKSSLCPLLFACGTARVFPVAAHFMRESYARLNDETDLELQQGSDDVHLERVDECTSDLRF